MREFPLEETGIRFGNSTEMGKNVSSNGNGNGNWCMGMGENGNEQAIPVDL